MQTMAATPAHEAMRRNSLLRGHVPPEDPAQPVPDREQEQQGAEPDHDVPGQVDGVDLARSVGRSSAGTVSRPWMTVLVPSAGSDSHEASPGIRMPPVTSPSALSRPSSVSGTSLGGLRDQLDGGELDRLVVVDPAGQRVADAHLDRDGDGADGERDDEARGGGSGRAGRAAWRRRRRRRRGSRRRRRRR